jgi:glycosyltransferase involved in cell wall biosynthesis
VVGVEHADRRRTVEEQLRAFRPDVVATQLIWSDVALRAARARGVPTVLRVPALPVRLDLRHGSMLAPTAVVAISEFVRREVESSQGRRARVIPSPVDLRSALVPEAERRPRFLTMFNPIDVKGGHTFRAVARRMPDLEFAAVPGWRVLRRADGSFDPEMMRRAAQTEGREYDGWMPNDVELSDLANVTILSEREAVREIYAVTRALLVPSVWPEALGRVTVEAFANGIPVVASGVGALADHVGRAGIVVDRHLDAASWEAAIRSLEDPEVTARCAAAGRRIAAEEFSLDRTIDAFAALFESVVALPRGATLDPP